MNKLIFKTLSLIVVMLTSSFGVYANTVEMADIMRENGKIYVVVAVVAIIFIGIISYLVSLDRKISRIEKEILRNKGQN